MIILPYIASSSRTNTVAGSSRFDGVQAQAQASLDIMQAAAICLKLPGAAAPRIAGAPLPVICLCTAACCTRQALQHLHVVFSSWSLVSSCRTCSSSSYTVWCTLVSTSLTPNLAFVAAAADLPPLHVYPVCCRGAGGAAGGHGGGGPDADAEQAGLARGHAGGGGSRSRGGPAPAAQPAGGAARQREWRGHPSSAGPMQLAAGPEHGLSWLLWPAGPEALDAIAFIACVCQLVKPFCKADPDSATWWWMLC